MDKLLSIVFAGMLCLATTRPAYAYFDMSTFWLVLQTVVAVAAGALLTVKLYWSHLIDRFRRGRDKEPTDVNE